MKEDKKKELEEENKNQKSELQADEERKRQKKEAQEEKIYPLREPSEDPRWSVRTVKIWIGFALTSLLFILIMLILGIFYD
jgi:hypothetical protein